MRLLMSLVAVVLFALVSLGAVSITNMKVTPLSPWCGYVSYDVTGRLPLDAEKYSAYVVLSNVTSHVKVDATLVDGCDCSLTLGHHQLTWGGVGLPNTVNNYRLYIEYEIPCSRAGAGHTTKTTSKAATCTTDGYIRTQCTYCNKMLSETIKPALRHDFVTDFDGSYYYKCRRCGEANRKWP